MSWEQNVVDVAAMSRALEAVGFKLPHCDVAGLRAPLRLVEGGLEVEGLAQVVGTLVVIGDLLVKGDVDLRRINGLANIVVTGDLRARVIYADAFVVVGGTLAAHTIIADSTWDGGLFVNAVEANTLVLKDIGLEPWTEEEVRLQVMHLADLEYEDEARAALPELFEGDKVDGFAFFLRRVAEQTA